MALRPDTPSPAAERLRPLRAGVRTGRRGRDRLRGPATRRVRGGEGRSASRPGQAAAGAPARAGPRRRVRDRPVGSIPASPCRLAPRVDVSQAMVERVRERNAEVAYRAYDGSRLP